MEDFSLMKCISSLFVLASIAEPEYNNHFLTFVSLQFYKHGSESLIVFHMYLF